MPGLEYLSSQLFYNLKRFFDFITAKRLFQNEKYKFHYEMICLIHRKSILRIFKRKSGWTYHLHSSF